MAGGYGGSSFGSRRTQKRDESDDTWLTVGKILGMGLVAAATGGVGALMPATLAGSAALAGAAKGGVGALMANTGTAAVDYATQKPDPRQVSTFQPIQTGQPRSSSPFASAFMQGGMTRMGG